MNRWTWEMLGLKNWRAGRRRDEAKDKERPHYAEQEGSRRAHDDTHPFQELVHTLCTGKQ